MSVMERTQLKGRWPYMDSFLNILRKPIQRGRFDGIVGNGMLSERAWQVYEIIQGSDRGPTQEEWGSMNINADLLDELEVTGMLEEALRTYYDCPTCHSRGERGFL